MTDNILTLVMENLFADSELLNGAKLNTIFQLAHVGMPDFSSELHSGSPLIPLTLTGPEDAMHSVADLARAYEDIVVIEGGDFSPGSLLNICTPDDRAKMALWMQAKAFKPSF